MKKGYYEHRNDLMFLLSEMLRRGFINQTDYAKGVAALDVVVDIATEIQSLDDSANEEEEMVCDEDTDLLRELENTSIPQSNHLRLQILIDDIDRNRYASNLSLISQMMPTQKELDESGSTMT